MKNLETPSKTGRVGRYEFKTVLKLLILDCKVTVNQEMTISNKHTNN